MDRAEFLMAHRDKWAKYHDHKEQMAFAATALYLGAAAWLIFGKDFTLGSEAEKPLRLTFMGFAAAAGFLFIGWQLRNRRIAANIVGACERLLVRIESGVPDTESVDAREYMGVLLPHYLFDEVVAVSQSNFWRGAATSEIITYLTLTLISVLAVIRVAG